MPNQKYDGLVNDTSVKFLDRAIADHHGNIKNYRTAYRQQKGVNPGAGVVFLTGFKSDMDGSKAEALAAWCASEKRDFLRFDYFDTQYMNKFVENMLLIYGYETMQ